MRHKLGLLLVAAVAVVVVTAASASPAGESNRGGTLRLNIEMHTGNVEVTR